MGKHQFKSEVNRLLDIIIHSLYSHSEIFLRELISNASDALDKLRYLSITGKTSQTAPFQIDIYLDDKERKILEVRDTGIGMSEKELQDHLGTIARSDTRSFLSHLSGEEQKDSGLIGKFGVGFYSAFMVAEKIEVISKRVGEDTAWKWESDGKGNYETSASSRESHGTTVRLHLNEQGKDYAIQWEIEQLIKKYSNHVSFPIFLSTASNQKEKQINLATAFWRRSKKDLKKNDYEEFFQSLSGNDDKPLCYVHTQAEGVQEYTTLFYVPSQPPEDLFTADYRSGVRLYVKRVFITDEKRELMPSYLRFIRGIIDSEDLPLNVSREMLQESKILKDIQTASVKRLLIEFERLMTDHPDTFDTFIQIYNKPLKEGMFSDFLNKDQLLKLIRFYSSEKENLVSLEDYVSRMLPDQKTIYYLSGDKIEYLKNSPLVAAYKQRGIEVLLMSDEIDEVIVPLIGKYKDKDLKPINQAGTEQELTSSTTAPSTPLTVKIKTVLEKEIKDVHVSSILGDIPGCVIWDAGDPSKRLQDILKTIGQTEGGKTLPILQINPDHALVKKLEKTEDETRFADLCWLLLYTGMLNGGITPEKTTDFARRLNDMLSEL